LALAKVSTDDAYLSEEFQFEDPEEKENPYLLTTIDPMEIGEMTEQELIQATLNYKGHVKQMADAQKDAKSVYDVLEAEVIRRFIEKGQTSGSFLDKFSGRHKTLYIVEDINPVSAFSYADADKGEAFIEFLERENYSHLKARTVGEVFAKFRSAVKEELKNRDGELPSGWDRFVNVLRGWKLNMRTK
jgi:hypothetical protein